MLRHVDQIEVAARFRKSLGDIEGLADSMDRLGLLQPLVITPENRLVAGQRRLEAARRLGWQEVPVVVADTLDDAVKLLQAERDENTQREPFSPSEAVALAAVLEPLERKAAAGRQGTRTDLQPPVNFTEGRALDKVAEAVGMSRPTLTKAREVVEAAASDPERFAPLVEEMDRTGRVNGAHKQLERAIRKETGGALAAVDAGDYERAESLLEAQLQELDAPATLPPPGKRQPVAAPEPPAETDVHKAVGIHEAMKYLAETSLTGADFKRIAAPFGRLVDEVRQRIPDVRALLAEIEAAP